MTLALELAHRGRGQVEPNPMVGAVLARDGQELARGWHKRFGGPHAEIVALTAARRVGADMDDATMYVTLEPCCHHGKTPPCTDALIAAGVPRVVVAIEDPDPQVAGGGVAKLSEVGIDVTVGVCQAEARRLLAPYTKLRTQHRPWVICKWAQTTDGYLALPPEAGRWISGESSRAYVHNLRGECDGVLVGVGTVLADDPLLTNRGRRGAQPCRVVLDSHLQTPPESQLVRTADQSPVLIATTADADSRKADDLVKAGAECIKLPSDGTGICLGALLDELGSRDWMHLLVEGGPKVLDSFICGGLADELMVFVPPGEQIAGAPLDDSLPRFDIAELSRKLPLPAAEEEKLGNDTLLHYVLGG